MRAQLDKRGRRAAIRTQVATARCRATSSRIPLPDLPAGCSLTSSARRPDAQSPARQRRDLSALEPDLLRDDRTMPTSEPLKAAYRILTWEKGRVQLDSSENKDGPGRDHQVDRRPADGRHAPARQSSDAWAGSAARKAPLNPRPLTAPLSALKHPELDVFQIVLSSGDDQTILDGRSSATTGGRAPDPPDQAREAIVAAQRRQLPPTSALAFAEMGEYAAAVSSVGPALELTLR